MTASDEESVGVIWIRSDVAADGSYVVSLETDEDTSFVMDRDTALAHAAAVVQVAQRAAYDAAVMRQLTRKTGMPLADAAELVTGMRADRPPVTIPGPLDLVPGVSQKTGKPFLAVWVHGAQVGQWDVADAESHALGVLNTVEAADLDSGYFRVLRATIGLEDGTARNVIDDLVNYR